MIKSNAWIRWFFESFIANARATLQASTLHRNQRLVIGVPLNKAPYSPLKAETIAVVNMRLSTEHIRIGYSRDLLLYSINSIISLFCSENQKRKPEISMKNGIWNEYMSLNIVFSKKSNCPPHEYCMLCPHSIRNIAIPRRKLIYELLRFLHMRFASLLLV